MLEPIRELLEQAKPVSAWQLAASSGQFPVDDDPDSLVLAARLAWQLGGRARSAWWIRKGWRLKPSHPEVLYYRALQVFERRGPYFCWEFLRQHDPLPEGTSLETRSSWYALFGQAAAALRDFERSESWFARALELTPDSPWLRVSQGYAYECEDRYDEALASAEEALRIRKNYRPAVQAKAHLLVLKHEVDEAIDFMTQVVNSTELGVIAGQCAVLLMEHKRFDQAPQMLDRYVELSPLLESRARRWVVSQRYELAYHREDFDTAISFAQRIKTPHMQKIAKRLAQPEMRQRKRIELEVPFVRQHHKTCAPATLTSIARFWQMTIDHIQLADEICYDGTTAYAERHWADTQGWYTREFTVTESAIQALITAGFPFTLTTTAPGSAHLQAVVGFDDRCGTFMIRDPFIPYLLEAQTEKFLEDQRSTGPRGMVLVPLEHRERLEAIELLDDQIRDALYQLDGALESHARERAGELLATVIQTWPDHELTVEAQRRLAHYDGNLLEERGAIEKQFALFPTNERLLMAKLSLMSDSSKRDERLAMLESACLSRTSHPVLKLMYASELSVDSRRTSDAIELVRRSLRSWSHDSYGFQLLANLLWDRQEREESLELHRVAACLDDKNERMADSYFLAARALGKTDEALHFLKRRFQHLGKRSSLPARTLFVALQKLDRSQESLEVLSQAIERRPDDGALKLFSARAFQAASSEYQEQASRWLAEAQGHVSPQEWLRTAASLASMRGEPMAALAYYQQLLESQPLSIPVYSAIASLTTDCQGREATHRFLADATQRHPNFYPLWELRCEWLQGEPLETREPIVRKALELNPDNAWARRELAFLLCEAGRYDEAWAEHHLAEHLEPAAAALFRLRSKLAHETGTIEEAREPLRTAIRLSVDDDYSIHMLMELASTPEERRAELEFIRKELQRQVTFGEGIIAFRRYALRVYESQELLNVCREALEHRPDLWQSWSAFTSQCLAVNDLEQAWATAIGGTDRFPLLPVMWVERAQVARALEDWPGQIESLETAYRINPNWNEVIQNLKDAKLHQGDFEGARKLIESAIVQNPQSPTFKLTLAELIWSEASRERQANRRPLHDKALLLLEEVIAVQPGLDEAWELLVEWSEVAEQPDLPEKVAQDLVAKRPNEARSYFMLARALYREEQIDQSLEAAERAIGMSPRFVDAYELKAQRLSAKGEFEAGIQSCFPMALGTNVPIKLRMTAAEIRAQSGDLEAAVGEIEVALRLEPNYAYGWYRLALWRKSLERWGAYRDACENLLKLLPQHDTAMGMLGEALLKVGHTEAAIRLLERAYSFNPEYEFAARELMKYYLAQQQLERAAAFAERASPFLASPSFLQLRIQLATLQKDRNAAQSLLARLCVTPGNRQALNESISLLEKAGWDSLVNDSLTSATDEADASADTYLKWGSVCASRSPKKYEAKVLQLAGGDKRQMFGVYGFLEGLATLRDYKTGRRFIKQHQSVLSAHTFLWGSTAYLLCEMHDWKWLVDFTKDYKQRDDREDWMMVNVSEGFLNSDDYQEGMSAARDAMSLGQGSINPAIRLLVAWDDWQQGEYESAIQLREATRDDDCGDDYLFVRELLELREAARQAKLGQRPDILVPKALFKKLNRAIRLVRNWRTQPARRRFLIETLAEVRRTFRSPLTRFRLLWFEAVTSRSV